MNGRSPIAALAVLSALFLATGGEGAAAEDFYAGKQVSLLVPSQAGSGYDSYARLLARYLPKHIPGAPLIVVQNMQGAGGLRLAAYLYNVAPKDGLTIALVENATPFSAFYGEAQAQFDPAGLSWLGSVSRETTLFLVSARLQARSIEEARGKEMHIAGSASTGAFYSRLLNATLGLQIKPVEGYAGLNDALLAMERGENDGYSFVFWSTVKAVHADWIAADKIRFLARYNDSAVPELGSVPLAEDVAQRPEDKQLLRAASAPFSLGRPLAAPPNIPSDRLSLLRRAVVATFIDPGYRADCLAQHFECDQSLEAERLSAIIADAYTVPESVHERLVALHRH